MCKTQAKAVQLESCGDFMGLEGIERGFTSGGTT